MYPTLMEPSVGWWRVLLEGEDQEWKDVLIHKNRGQWETADEQMVTQCKAGVR